MKILYINIIKLFQLFDMNFLLKTIQRGKKNLTLLSVPGKMSTTICPPSSITNSNSTPRFSSSFAIFVAPYPWIKPQGKIAFKCTKHDDENEEEKLHQNDIFIYYLLQLNSIWMSINSRVFLHRLQRRDKRYAQEWNHFLKDVLRFLVCWSRTFCHPMCLYPRQTHRRFFQKKVELSTSFPYQDLLEPFPNMTNSPIQEWSKFFLISFFCSFVGLHTF